MKIITLNEEIVASDDQFLNYFNSDSLDDLKMSIDSILMFSLLGETDSSFNFELKGQNFFVSTCDLNSDYGMIKLYTFQNSSDSNKDLENSNESFTLNQIPNEQPLNLDNSPSQTDELELNLNQPNEEQPLDLGQNIIEEPNNNQIELSLDLDNSPSQTDELELNLNQPNEEQPLDLGQNIIEEPNNNQIELSLDLDNSPSQTDELELNLNQPNEEQPLDLGQNIIEEPNNNQIENSLDLGIEDDDDLLDLGIELEEEHPIKVEEKTEIKENNSNSLLDIDFGFDDIDDIADIENLEKNKTTLSEDIQKFLQLSKSELSEDIKKELKKASDDLGVNIEMMEQFFDDFKTQVEDEKVILLENIKNENYEEIHKSAHKLKGVALNLRLTYFGELFKTIDNMSKNHEEIDDINSIVENIYNLTEKLKEEKLILENDLSKEDQSIMLSSFKEVIEYYIETYSNDTEEISTIINDLKYAQTEIGITNISEKIDELKAYSKEDVISFLKTLTSLVKKEI